MLKTLDIARNWISIKYFVKCSPLYNIITTMRKQYPNRHSIAFRSKRIVKTSRLLNPRSTKLPCQVNRTSGHESVELLGHKIPIHQWGSASITQERTINM